RPRSGPPHTAPPQLPVQSAARSAARLALDPVRAGVDDRWRKVDVPAYLKQVQAFARDTGFAAFFAGEERRLAAVETRVGAALRAAGVDGWFDATFGPRPGVSFFVCPGMLVGPWSYSATAELRRGPRARLPV